MAKKVFFKEQINYMFANSLSSFFLALGGQFPHFLTVDSKICSQPAGLECQIVLPWKADSCPNHVI